MTDICCDTGLERTVQGGSIRDNHRSSRQGDSRRIPLRHLLRLLVPQRRYYRLCRRRLSLCHPLWRRMGLAPYHSRHFHDVLPNKHEEDSSERSRRYGARGSQDWTQDGCRIGHLVESLYESILDHLRAGSISYDCRLGRSSTLRFHSSFPQLAEAQVRSLPRRTAKLYADFPLVPSHSVRSLLTLITSGRSPIPKKISS